MQAIEIANKKTGIRTWGVLIEKNEYGFKIDIRNNGKIESFDRSLYTEIPEHNHSGAFKSFMATLPAEETIEKMNPVNLTEAQQKELNRWFENK